MEYIYAALLLHAAKKEVSEANVTGVLKGAGVATNDARVKALIASLEGKNIDEIIKGATAAPVAVAAPAAEKKAEKKEEKKEEKNEEEATAGLGALFG
ncbi:MAG: 50S ribosomal protein P1 [Candidatus Thermoplasmatota archaeon]|nr:50S ribosomal protein P1 [Candidatus Thermoplasmatota archaeon]